MTTYDASHKKPRTFTPFTHHDSPEQPALRLRFARHADASQLLECLQESMRVAKELGGAPVELVIPGSFATAPEDDRSLKLDALTLDGAEELPDGATLVKKLVETDDVIASAMVHRGGVTLIVGAGERSAKLSLQSDGFFELIGSGDTYVAGRVGEPPSPSIDVADAVIHLSGSVGDLTEEIRKALALLGTV